MCRCALTPLHLVCVSPLPLGSRIASWLPSFSVEVMHTTNILGIVHANNSQLNAMVSLTGYTRQVYNKCGLIFTRLKSFFCGFHRPIRSRRCFHRSLIT